MQTYYYPRTIRRIAAEIISVFNELRVYNYQNPISGATSAASEVSVPIVMGPVDRAYWTRLEERSGKRYYDGYPSMALTFEGLQYDSSRTEGAKEFRQFHEYEPFDTLSSFFQDTIPTPFDLSFTLHIRTAINDHILQIIENVCAYFNPYLILRMKEFVFLNIARDVRLELSPEISMEYPEEINEESSREFKTKLNLTAKAWLYKPISSVSMIRVINSKYYINNVDLSGSDSEYNVLTEEFSTSGVSGYRTSAFPPTSQYNLSAYNSETDDYYFTSANSNG